MGIIELLMTAVGAPLAKILLKSYLGATTSDLSAGLIDIAKKKIKDYSDQREAQRVDLRRLFAGLGERNVILGSRGQGPAHRSQRAPLAVRLSGLWQADGCSKFHQSFVQEPRGCGGLHQPASFSPRPRDGLRGRGGGWLVIEPQQHSHDVSIDNGRGAPKGD